MKSTSVPFSKTGYFSNLVLDYLSEKTVLKALYNYPVSIDSFAKVISDKQKQKMDRTTLVTVLRNQYEGLNTIATVKANIDALQNENTFTVTTAHQPNLFLGPLYFLYKIASAINLAKQVQQSNPGYKIVPVYFMGSEDHDVAELAQITLAGKKIEWNPNQSGAFGRMKTTGLEQVIDEVKGMLLGSTNADSTIQLIQELYNGQNTITQATRLLVNKLFGEYGLVIIDGDDERFKKLYTHVIEDELLNQQSEKLVTPVIEVLEKEYTVQAKPRSINLFYLKDNGRNRIEREKDGWVVLNTAISFSGAELKKEINEHPEHFSPNVLMRGLYQEILLPNLAFVGGGAEVSYWLELKPLFDFYKVNYPMIVLRTSCLIMDGMVNTKIHKIGFTEEDMFLSADTLIKNYILKTSASQIQLNGLKQKTEELFTSLKEKAIAIDPTLEASVMAEKAKADKGIENIEQKMIRAEKRKQEEVVKKIGYIKERLFPNNGLQERSENFLSFYTKYGEGLIKDLIDNTNPLEKNFVIITEE